MRDTSELELMLQGYGLTTAKFLYHLPDHPHLLQTFIWQHYDLAPKFPVLSASSISGRPSSKARCIR